MFDGTQSSLVRTRAVFDLDDEGAASLVPSYACESEAVNFFGSVVNDLARSGPCTVVVTMSVDRFEIVYRRMHHRLWRALLAFGADPELASDAVAEAFSQAIARGSDVRDVEAWVWRSAFRIAGGMLAERARSPSYQPTTFVSSSIR